MAATLHDVFVDRLTDLQTLSEAAHKAETGQAQRKWMVPADWVGDPLLIDKQHLPAFDRADANGEYQQVHQGSAGHVGEASSLKIQIDYVSAMERAFRSRHATPIRCIMHAAARHRGHGHAQGVFGAVRNYAQDLIDAAGA